MTVRRSGRAGSIGALFLLAVIWGGSIPVTKLGLRDVPPLTLTALRYAVAAPWFAVLLMRGPAPSIRVVVRAAALGAFGIGVGQVAQTLGVRVISASVATVISALIPILVVALARVRFRQPLPGRQAFALALAFVGVALVAGGDPRDLVAAPGRSALAGEVLMLISAVAVALYYVLGIGLLPAPSVMTVAAISSLAGAGVLIPAAAWELRHASAAVTAVSVFAVLYLALLVTVLGLLIWFSALTRLPASVAAVLQYLQPVVGVAASWALFGDPIGMRFVAGAALVLLGVGLGTTGRVDDLGEWRPEVVRE